MSYKSLGVWKISKDLVVDITNMSLEKLPKFEMYQTGSQIRRSIKSVKLNAEPVSSSGEKKTQ